MSKKLRGKVAIVTGSSKGIGAGIAAELASEGARVVINYASSRSDADTVVADIIERGGEAVAIQADVSQAQHVRSLVESTVKAFGRLDILVNNAGVFENGFLEQFSSEVFHRLFDLNVLGLLLTTQAAVERMGPGSAIINIGSNVTRLRLPGSTVYCATKAAVDSITPLLARELAPRKIRVNSVNPGYTDTEGTRSAGVDMPDGFLDQLVSQVPLGRVGKPEDIAKVAAFLASDDAGWVTGEIVTASGGW